MQKAKRIGRTLEHRSGIFLDLLIPLLFVSIFGGIQSHPLTAQTMRPMELEDLFRSRRVSDPQLSPDGKTIAFVVTVVDKPANKTNSDIWTIPAAGGDARQLTNNPSSEAHPRWSPDGKWIAFESNRDGPTQIYLMNPEGGDVRKLTTVSTEASQAIWSPDGKAIAFVSAVFPEFSDQPFAVSDSLNKQKLDERENSKVKARIITRLLYRHWNSWVDDRRQHVFVMPLDGQPRDVTPGDRDAVPTSSTFSAGDDFDFSPDGRELAYTATPTPPHIESWSTNHDVYTVNLGTGERKQITTNPAADGFPRYSPDGKYIAYRAQSEPGFESSRWQLMLYDRATGKIHRLTEHFDSWVEAFVWSRDSKTIYYEAEEKGNKPLWSVTIAGNDVRKVVDNAVNGDINISPDGAMLYFSHQTLSRPIEIYSSTVGQPGVTQISHINDELFSQLQFSPPEPVWFTGAEGTKVQMWVIKPPEFVEGRKYPLLFMVHGGPQGAWLNAWSTRWNPELWAAQGYVIALPNPRGSTGFGQKFVDEISRDWGGKPFTDLMAGLAAMEKLPYVDTSHMAAAGASYGGYMMNWFEGHTDKFKTIVCHDGVYDFDNMYGATDEKWFEEWEHGIPWETKDFDKYSPHKYAANFKTPMLIVHSQNDFRIPLSEGLSMFTALQRKGIPSKLLYFSNEDHFVLKPLDSELWHKTVSEWLGGYLR